MNQNCKAHSAGLLRARSQPLPRLPIWRLTVVFLSQRVLAPIMRKQELCLNMILMPVLSFQHSYSDREELLQRLWPGRATRETMTTRQRPMTEKTGTVGRRIRQNQKIIDQQPGRQSSFSGVTKPLPLVLSLVLLYFSRF